MLIHFDKNGFVYTLDRATGELLSAEPYVPVNWARRIDLKSGRPEVDSTKLTGASRGTVKDICPSLEGGKNQQPAAWSPATQLFYLSTSNMCMDYTSFQASYLAGTPYLSAGAPYNVGPGGNLGAFIAWDPVKSRRAWEIKEPYPVWSGVLATGAAWCSMARSTDGSRRWMRTTARCSGSSRWALA